MKTFEVKLSDKQCDQLLVVANKTRDFVIEDDDDAQIFVQGILDEGLKRAYIKAL